MAQEKILIGRGTKARIETIKGNLLDYEIVYATDTNELGVKLPNGDMFYIAQNKVSKSGDFMDGGLNVLELEVREQINFVDPNSGEYDVSLRDNNGKLELTVDYGVTWKEVTTKEYVDEQVGDIETALTAILGV